MRTTLRRLAAPAALAWTACSDPPCGVGDAPADGLVLAGGDTEVRFAGLVAGANNDCPAPDAPGDVVSLTIAGTQAGGAAPITFCVPRPDRLDGTRALGTEVQVVDVFADAGGCALSLADTPAPTGTVTARGVCGDGVDPAGFALTFDGAVTVERSCGAPVTMTLTGTIAVTAPPI